MGRSALDTQPGLLPLYQGHGAIFTIQMDQLARRRRCEIAIFRETLQAVDVEQFGLFPFQIVALIDKAALFGPQFLELIAPPACSSGWEEARRPINATASAATPMADQHAVGALGSGSRTRRELSIFFA